MFGLDELLAVMPTPALPTIRFTDAQWLAIYGTVGTRLPGDYVAAYKAYGEGAFSSQSHRMSANLYWHDWNPGMPGRGVFGCLNELRLIKAKRKDAIPFPLYFEPGGLLPWGKLTNGAHICWRATSEIADGWTTVVVRPASKQFESFDMSAIQFLARLIKGTIKSELMPEGFPGSKGVGFQPLGRPERPFVPQYPLKS